MWKKCIPLILLVLLVAYLGGVFERFDNPDSRRFPKCDPAYRQCPSGDCVLKSDRHAGCPEVAGDAY